MDEEYSIVSVEKPEEGARRIVVRGLDDFNVQQAGDFGLQSLFFALKAPDGEIAGGAFGDIFWGWFHLDVLWVHEKLRGRGYGSRLLKRIEDEARQRGAQHIYLDTFSFQAPEFYKRFGYRVFGELNDFPPGHQHYFLVKEL